jgi:hypothetical protein
LIRVSARLPGVRVSDDDEKKRQRFHLYKRSKSGIGALFLFKLVFPVELMGTIGDKETEMRHGVEQNITDTFDNGIRLLSFVEGIAQAGVDSDNVVNVPKDLFEKVGSTWLGNNILVFDAVYPGL